MYRVSGNINLLSLLLIARHQVSEAIFIILPQKKKRELIIGGIVSHKKDMSGTFGDKFNPWWGTKMPYAMKHSQKMKKKKNTPA